ncbi:MAG: sulfotransferase [Panacagrimonas sp.]
MTGPVAASFLPAGAELVAWIRQGGKPERAGAAFLWGYRWRAYWFEKNLNMQRRRFKPAAFGNGAGLILALGLWRSGTTLLHEVLASFRGVGYPQTWQCMNPSSFALQAPPTRTVAVKRPMDSVMIDAFSPQEDEFFLLAIGLPSIYRAFADPRRWKETQSALAQKTWSADAGSWTGPWLEFLGWCAGSQMMELAVKSPNHVFRLQGLAQALPQAGHAWVLRDPEPTWQSNRKMWTAMFELYGLWNWKPADLDDLLAASFTAYADALDVAMSIETRRRWAIRFEDLSANPAAAIPGLARALGLDAGRVDAARVPRARPPEVYRRDESLVARFGPLFERIRRSHDALIGRFAG